MAVMRNLSMEIIAWIVILLLISDAEGYKNFQERIPNGDGVPHPCIPNYLWQGVGHENRDGGGARNQFGKDFKDANMKWTVDLCRKDSDGDGKTNGQELGDPDCKWIEGQAPEVTLGLSHPGICEPVDSDYCKPRNSWVTCDTKEFRCDALNKENPADLRNVTLRFRETIVPPTETNYYCMTFDLPQDDDYHMIATQPIIDNAYVMHHIVAFACTYGAPEVPTPRPCGMATSQCFTTIGLWTVGMNGECLHEDAGFHVGKNGYKKILLQFHWNNPLLIENYKDSSGLLLHLTKNRRLHNAGSLSVGQTYLEIPPGEKRVIQRAQCSSTMSRTYMNGPIRFMHALNHMHYLGRSMRIEHYRNDVKLRDITNEKDYSYDSPKVFVFQDSIEFLRGDELKVSCEFQSTSRSKTVFWGDGTSDEMCYGFITYYPAENMPYGSCMNWKELDILEFYFKQEMNGCFFNEFLNITHPDTIRLHERVMSHCSFLSRCVPECIPVIKEVKGHPCMQGDIGDWLRLKARTSNPELGKFYSAVDSCDTEIAQRYCPRIKQT